MGRHRRAQSFHDVDPEQSSGILSDVLKEANVYLGGSSMGRGLKQAARYYLDERDARAVDPEHLTMSGAQDLNQDCNTKPNEEPFYIVDLGVVVSQVYQWRRFFPRVEPFYAVKCNPDPVIIKTLAILGCNFDCASRAEIRLVEEASAELPRKPDIIYANPCKARAHLIEAVCKGVRMVTFDNAVEIQKCAAVSTKIELVLRIATDDRGSRCRFSTKFGAPRYKWRPLLAAAKQYGMQVVGVSFHVGSGCRDASKYDLALKDAKEIFEMAKKDYGMNMKILDIGGGFPGETHSLWNPAEEIDDEESEEEGVEVNKEKDDDDHFMFFTEIAAEVAPALDKYFPPDCGVRIIGEPGRYIAAASATLCCSVVSARSSAFDASFEPSPVDDHEAAAAINEMTREEENDVVHQRIGSMDAGVGIDNAVFASIQEELNDYSKLYASQQLAQQEFDVYNDRVNLYEEGYDTAVDLLGPPSEQQMEQMEDQLHTVEGMNYSLVAASADLEAGDMEASAMITLAAAGEAAVKGLVLQAVADTDQLQDDYAYYINDGVYGAFNNIMFDHANVRPRVLRKSSPVEATTQEDGFQKLDTEESSDDEKHQNRDLYASTVFGPTCDSIDVIARSVLLPKLDVGDWMYFQNMGAYTMAAASSFNGFSPSEKFYVCSVQPEYFEGIIKHITTEHDDEEKKTD